MDVLCNKQRKPAMPGSVPAALHGLLDTLRYLLQAQMINTRELKGALKQVLREFSMSEDICLLGQHGPYRGLPTPLELVRWLLFHCDTLSDADQTHQGHLCVLQQNKYNSNRSAPSLLLPAADRTSVQAATSAPAASHDPTAIELAAVELADDTIAATTAAGNSEQQLQQAPKTPEHAEGAAARKLKPRRCRIKTKQARLARCSQLANKLQDRSFDCCMALEVLHNSKDSTASLQQTLIRTSAAPGQEADAARTMTAVQSQQQIEAYTSVAEQEAPVAAISAPAGAAVQGNSLQQLHVSAVSTRYQELCEAQTADDTMNTAADQAGSAHTAEAAAAVPSRSNMGSSPAGAEAQTGTDAGAAVMRAGTSGSTAAADVALAKPVTALKTGPAVPVAACNKVGHAIGNSRPAVPFDWSLVQLRGQVSLQGDLVPTTTTTAAAAHEGHGSRSTTADPIEHLKKLIAIKKLQLAGFQQELRCKLVSKAPNKQYCHVSLPGAPAGGVWTVAGTDTAAAAGGGGGSDVVVRKTGGRVERLRVLCSRQELYSRQQRGTAQLQQHTSLKKSHADGILEQHKLEAAEYQRKREEAAAARLSALKNASLPEYLDMLKQAKNGRLQQVLEQTDSCLRQLAAKIGVQDLLDKAGADADVDDSVSIDEGDAAAGIICSSSAWSRLAAQLPADISEQPAGLKGGQLREYQMQGVRWLVGLSEKGLNGILADDMGLGKTVQVIAMICHLVEVKQSSEPFLIICPASVVSNWANELTRWAPDLSVVQYKGSAEAREQVYLKQVRKKSFNVLLTTYELLIAPADRGRLSRIRWRGLVVDEGHRLKNADCKLAQELRAYNSRSRLLLTGTPLQNKLSELWSLLNFLMPDVFNSADDFDTWFGAPLQAIKDAQSGCAAESAGSAAEASMLSQEEYLLVTNRLHQVLRPFMMRRLKESVATELPGKTEVVLRCPLSPYQAALYDLVKTKVRNEAAAGTAGSSKSSSSSSSSAGIKGVNNAVMELRNICNHPMLSKLHPEYGEDLLHDPTTTTSSSSSALSATDLKSRLPAVLRLSCKVDLLDQVLTRLSAGGHKVLLFCTMTRLLDVLEEYLDWRGFTYLRLDGATGAQDRAEAVTRFNQPGSDVFIFMLSLRAGGVGLNLQAADTVIMFDSDWNPQIDLQAQARAHRLGQTRQVLVVRLVAENTIEEHILQVAEQKRRFADSSITGGFFDGQTSAEARRQYLLQVLDTNPTAAAAAAGGAAAAAAGGAAAAAAGWTASRLNSVLARSDEELQMLQDRECKLAAADQQQQQRLQGDKGASIPMPSVGDRVLCRVATESESAELIAAAREAAAPKPEEDLDEYGRGRKRGAAAGGAGDQQGAAAATRKRQCKQVAAAAERTTAPVRNTAATAARKQDGSGRLSTRNTVAKASNATDPAAAAAVTPLVTTAALQASNIANQAAQVTPAAIIVDKVTPEQPTAQKLVARAPAAAAAAQATAEELAAINLEQLGQGTSKSLMPADAVAAVAAIKTAAAAEDASTAALALSKQSDDMRRESPVPAAAPAAAVAINTLAAVAAAGTHAAAEDAAAAAMTTDKLDQDTREPAAPLATSPAAATPAVPGFQTSTDSETNLSITPADSDLAVDAEPAVVAQAAAVAAEPAAAVVAQAAAAAAVADDHLQEAQQYCQPCATYECRPTSLQCLQQAFAAATADEPHEHAEDSPIDETAAVTATAADQGPSTAAVEIEALTALAEADALAAAAAAAGAVEALAGSSRQEHELTSTVAVIRRRPGRPNKAEAAARLAAEAAAAAAGTTGSGSGGTSRTTRRSAAAAAAAAVGSAALVEMDTPSVAAVKAVDESAGTEPRSAGNSAAAAAGSGGNGGSSSGSSKCMSETVAVCCGTAQGWYSTVREDILLKQPQQQQLQGRKTRACSSGIQQQQQQAEIWMSLSAFMKLGGESHKHDAKKAIKVLLPDGSRGMSIKTYIKQYERWEQQQQQQQRPQQQQQQGSNMAAVTAAAAAIVGGSSRGFEEDGADHTVDPAPAAAAPAVARRKRGRPSKAEAAARLAAEAAALCGSSRLLRGTSPIQSAAERRCANSKQGAAAAAADDDDDDDDGDTQRCKKRRSVDSEETSAAAAVADVVADAAAVFDTMYDRQHSLLDVQLQQQQVPLLVMSQVADGRSANDENVGDAGRMFDLVWGRGLQLSKELS